MKIVAVIPMKLNNERLPCKNIKPFKNGKPLCQYIMNTLLEVDEIDEIYVYCSDESIEQYFPRNIKFLKRSATLDSDATKINEVIKSFSCDVDADIYVLAHATAPFLKASTIRLGIEKVLSDGFDSAFSVTKNVEFIWRDNKPLNYDLENIPRTQDLSPVFFETSGLYIYARSLIQKNRRIGDNPFLIEVDKIEACDINNAVDFDIADAIFNAGLTCD